MHAITTGYVSGVSLSYMQCQWILSGDIEGDYRSANKLIHWPF